jgi:hypothetical protein
MDNVEVENVIGSVEDVIREETCNEGAGKKIV